MITKKTIIFQVDCDWCDCKKSIQFTGGSEGELLKHLYSIGWSVEFQSLAVIHYCPEHTEMIKTMDKTIWRTK